MNIPQTLTKYPKNRPSNPVQVKKVGIVTKKTAFWTKNRGDANCFPGVTPKYQGFSHESDRHPPESVPKRGVLQARERPGEAGERGKKTPWTSGARFGVSHQTLNGQKSMNQSKRRGNRFSGKISLPSLTPLRGGSVTELLANSCKFPAWSLVGWRKGPVGSWNSGQLDDFLKNEKKRGQMRAFGCHSGPNPGFQLKNIIFPKDPIFFGSFRPISVSGGFFPPNC